MYSDKTAFLIHPPQGKVKIRCLISISFSITSCETWTNNIFEGIYLGKIFAFYGHVPF